MNSICINKIIENFLIRSLVRRISTALIRGINPVMLFIQSSLVIEVKFINIIHQTKFCYLSGIPRNKNHFAEFGAKADDLSGSKQTILVSKQTIQGASRRSQGGNGVSYTVRTSLFRRILGFWSKVTPFGCPCSNIKVWS